MNRAELQALSAEYLTEARALLAANQWAGAYSLAGYSVEVALKSCVLARIERHGRIFDDETFLKKLGTCWTHDLTKLILIAELNPELTSLLGVNAAFTGNWGVAKDWNETSRYKRKSKDEAESLLEAITNEPDGVLAWIKHHW